MWPACHFYLQYHFWITHENEGNNHQLKKLSGNFTSVIRSNCSLSFEPTSTIHLILSKHIMKVDSCRARLIDSRQSSNRTFTRKIKKSFFFFFHFSSLIWVAKKTLIFICICFGNSIEPFLKKNMHHLFGQLTNFCKNFNWVFSHKSSNNKHQQI